jgi:hypothetical protein
MDIWTIYNHPTDYPDNFVARRYVIENGIITATSEVRLADTLDGIRQKLPMGLYCFSRQFDDDPNIVESWV